MANGSLTQAQAATGLAPVTHAPALRNVVREQLEQLIISRELQPGRRLVETELAEQLGVSRGPVREALQLLAKDKWVDLQARHGAFVHVPTEKETENFFGLRRVLEIEATRLATLRVTDEDRALLRAHSEEGLRMLGRGTDPFDQLAGPSMHREIARIADNEDLSAMLELLWKRARWYIGGAKVSRRGDEWREHAEIVEAICAGDVEAACRATTEHVDGSREAYLSQLVSDMKDTED